MKALQHTLNNSIIIIIIINIVEVCVAEWLTPQTLDLEVRGSSLACHVVSLDNKLYSTL